MPESEKKERLDKVLSGKLPNISRSIVQELIKKGKVKVDGKTVIDSRKLVTQEAKIEFDDSELTRPISPIELEILYEDDDCIVISKPTGVLSHSKGAFSSEGTVATWLAGHIEKEEAGTPGNRNGIVHRLDRATSGVMICAKNERSLKWLQKQFSTRKVTKHYIALVEGKISPKEALIDMPIERNPKRPQTFRVGANGKPAQTIYKTEQYIELPHKTLSLVRLMPKTGRTHQLRVHLSNLGYPIVGDTFYGGMNAERLYLHALSLEVTLTNKKRMTFSSKLPPEFNNPKIS